VNERPIRLIVSDDLRRSRFTVFFRLLLALPHLIWLVLWGIAALIAAILNWFATLIAGTSPRGLHDFLAAYVRYAVHVTAYLFLAANPFPDFLGRPGYPIDVEIAPPAPQNRWKVGFRIVLAVPAMIISGALSSSGMRSYGANYGAGLLGTTGFLGWFASLARARMPRGLRDAMAYALFYAAQLDAYLFLLTDRYPDSDPQAAIGEPPVRADPIGLTVGGEPRRSRLTVFFRLLLALPHLVWLTLWGIVAYLTVIVNWIATLVRGVSPQPLHRFLAAYLRYQTHVYAYLFLVANPFPGFTGRAGSYPVDPSIEGPRRQNRWTVLFRLLLAVPALLIASAYGGLLFTVAVLAWFASLATGRLPLGLRNAGALALRYTAQAGGYELLLTDSYPYTGPTASGPIASNSPATGPVAGGSIASTSTPVVPEVPPNGP
jgi:Domain of unknown function (DUF4389)